MGLWHDGGTQPHVIWAIMENNLPQRQHTTSRRLSKHRKTTWLSDGTRPFLWAKKGKAVAIATVQHITPSDQSGRAFVETTAPNLTSSDETWHSLFRVDGTEPHVGCVYAATPLP